MGIAIKKLYVTNTHPGSGRLFMTGNYKPIYRDGKYYIPPGTAAGFDMFVPDVLDIGEEQKTVPVKVVETDKETGLWLMCYDDFFGNEQHLFEGPKPKFKEGTDKWDWEEWEEHDDGWQLHVWTDIDMKSGDGPIPVTLEITNEFEE